ncbi:MAG TPA: hypothetical protein VH207_14060 [Chthoniobacterales bacterium]|nr:hypothetical protein [Chthoniobacterales bacterium]
MAVNASFGNFLSSVGAIGWANIPRCPVDPQPRLGRGGSASSILKPHWLNKPAERAGPKHYSNRNDEKDCFFWSNSLHGAANSTKKLVVPAKKHEKRD